MSNPQKHVPKLKAATITNMSQKDENVACQALQAAFFLSGAFFICSLWEGGRVQEVVGAQVATAVLACGLFQVIQRPSCRYEASDFQVRRAGPTSWGVGHRVWRFGGT